jgi:hypothetical protein
LLMGFWWDFKEIMQFWTWIFHILMRDPTDEKLPISPCVAGRIPAWRAMSSRSHRRALPQCLQRQSRTGKKSKAGFWRFSGDVFCISICNELSLSIIYNVYNYIYIIYVWYYDTWYTVYFLVCIRPGIYESVLSTATPKKMPARQYCYC